MYLVARRFTAGSVVLTPRLVQRARIVTPLRSTLLTHRSFTTDASEL